MIISIFWPPSVAIKPQGCEYKEGIQLNDVAANKVIKLYSFIKKQYYLVAFFNKQDAINTLGDIQVRQWYTVELSGQLTSGAFFGGAQKFKIVR